MRITVWLAVLFGAVGAGIATVVHFASGHAVSDDVGVFSYSSLPRRYADYLPVQVTGIAGHRVYPSWLPALPAGIGAGVIAGLLLGVLFARSGFRLVRDAA
jgi:hypothetical protein